MFKGYKRLLKRKSCRVYLFYLTNVQGVLRSNTHGVITKAGSFSAAFSKKSDMNDDLFEDYLAQHGVEKDDVTGEIVDGFVQQQLQEDAQNAGGVLLEPDPFENYDPIQHQVHRPEPQIVEEKSDGEENGLHNYSRHHNERLIIVVNWRVFVCKR